MLSATYTAAFVTLIWTAGVCAIVALLNLLNLPRSAHKTDPVPIAAAGFVVALLIVATDFFR